MKLMLKQIKEKQTTTKRYIKRRKEKNKEAEKLHYGSMNFLFTAHLRLDFKNN